MRGSRVLNAASDETCLAIAIAAN
jgi:hypothetical protein